MKRILSRIVGVILSITIVIVSLPLMGIHSVKAKSITNARIDIVLLVDTSGSMSGSAHTNAISAAKAICNDIFDYSSNARIGVVSFASSSKSYGFSADKSVVLNNLSQLGASGGTYIVPGINNVKTLMSTAKEYSAKSVVIISDGEISESQSSAQSAISPLKEDCNIISVGVGASSSGAKVLTAIANKGYYSYSGGTLSKELLATLKEGYIAPAFATEQQAILEMLAFDINQILDDIKFEGGSLNFPDIPIKGESQALGSLEAKIDLPLGSNLTYTVDMDEKKIKVLIGFKDDQNATIGPDGQTSTYWSESYRKVKTMYQNVTGKKVDTTRLWNEFSSIRGSLKKLDCSLGVGVSAQIAGYVEFSYETNELKFDKGGVLVAVDSNIKFESNLKSPYGVFASMGLTPNLGGSLTVEEQNSKLIFMGEVTGSLSAYIGLGFGSKLAQSYVEGKLNGTISASFKFPKATFNEAFSAQLTASVSAEAKVFGFDVWEDEWPLTDITLFPSSKTVFDSMSIGSDFDVNELYTEAETSTRDYTMSVQSINNKFQLYDIYERPEPKLVQLENGMIMLVWIGDNGQKDIQNKTSVFYSVYDGNTWSESRDIALCDGYCSSPKVAVYGDKVYVVWQQTNSAIEPNDLLSDVVTDVDLYYACFDNGTFSSAMKISDEDNNCIEFAQSIVATEDNLFVTWIENSNNDIFMKSGTSCIKYVDVFNENFGDAVTVLETESMINDYMSFVHEESVEVAYSVANDANLYVSQSPVYSGNGYVFNISLVDDTVLFLDGMTLVGYDLSTGMSKVMSDSYIFNYSLVSGDNETAILYKVEEAEKECIKVAYFDEAAQTFGDFKIVYENDNHISAFSALFDKNSELQFAISACDIDFERDKVFDNYSLFVDNEKIKCDISVGEGAWVENEIVSGGKATIGFIVKNQGNVVVDNITYTLTDLMTGNILTTGELDSSLNVNEEKTYYFDCDLPDEFSHRTFKIEVDAADDANTKNDFTEFAVGKVDLAIESVSSSYIDGQVVVYGQVTNKGYLKATDVQLYSSDFSRSRDFISETSLGDLECGQTTDFSFVLPTDLCATLEEDTLRAIDINVNAEQFDNNVENNEFKYLYQSLLPFSVATISDKEISITSYSGESETVRIPESIDGYNVVNISDLSSSANIKDLYISKNVRQISQSIFTELSNIENIVVDEANNNYTVLDGVLFNKDLSTLVFHPNTASIDSYNVPKDVRVIGVNAFANNRGLKSVTLSDNVYKIQQGAFYDCDSLEQIVLGKNISSIGNNAFSPNTKIRCYFDSTAKYYAESNDIPFSIIDLLIPVNSGGPFINYDDYMIFGVYGGEGDIESLLTTRMDYKFKVDNSTPIGNGDTVELTNSNGETIETYTVTIEGDVNSDGRYDGQDSVILECIVSGVMSYEQLSGAEFDAADCDNDGELTNNDIVMLNNAGVFIENIPQLCAEPVEFTYNVLEDNCVEITGIKENAKSIFIPAELDGYKVKSIANEAFLSNYSLKYVEIAEGVQTIGDYVFNDLVCLVIPRSLSCMGETSCSVEVVRYSANETEWYSMLMNGQDYLQHFYNKLYCNGKFCDTSYYIYDNQAIAIYERSEKSEITVPSSIAGYPITSVSFYECNNLENVVIPDSVTNLDYAFYNCVTIGKLTIPKSVTSMVDICGYDTHVTEVYYEGTEDEWYTLMMNGADYSNPFYDKLYCNGVLCDAMYYIDGETASAYYNQSEATEVIVPSAIGGYPITRVSFYECQNLQNVVIPDGVTNLDFAFGNCGTVGKLTIPKSITSMVDICGYDTHVTEVYYEGTEDEWYSLMMNGTDYFDTFYDKLYCNGELCEAKYYIYDGTASVYYEQAEATEITVPATIGGYPITGTSLYQCPNLERLYLSEGITSVNDLSYYECNKLETIYIPSSVEHISPMAFMYLEPNVNIVIDENNEYYTCIDGVVFNKDKTELIRFSAGYASQSYVVPETVAVIAESAFDGCDKLTDIVLPDNLTSIGDSAFSNCSSLTSIRLPDGITSIGDSTFSNCSSLTSVTLPEGFTSIGDNAFSGCSALESITLPEGLKTIGASAFARCKSITSITIPSSVDSIGTTVFLGCDKLGNIYVSAGNKSYSSADGIVYNADKTTLITCAGGKSGAVSVPSTVSKIAERAFYECTQITSITLPSSLRTIEKYAFSRSGIETIVIPEGVTSIGGDVFSNCPKLVSASLPGTLTEVGTWLFWSCDELKTVTLGEGLTKISSRMFYDCPKLTDITIPKSVNTIEYGAFDNCSSLEQVTIPSGVTKIDGSVFSGCTSLTTVEIPNTVTKIDSYAFEDCTALLSVYIPSSVTEISSSAFRDTTTTIKCDSGSKAYEFAVKNGLPYEIV